MRIITIGVKKKLQQNKKKMGFIRKYILFLNLREKWGVVFQINSKDFQ